MVNNKKLLLGLLFIFLFILPIISAEQNDIPTYKQGEDILVSFTCNDEFTGEPCDVNFLCNITYIQAPDSSIILNETVATKIGLTYSIELSNTDSLGKYNYQSFCSNGSIGGFSNIQQFLITKSGENRTTNIYIPLVPIIFFAIMMFILGIIYTDTKLRIAFFGLAILMGYVAIQYTSIIIQGYSFTNNTGAESYFTIFYQAVTWIVGGAITISLFFIILFLKKLIDINKGFRDDM